MTRRTEPNPLGLAVVLATIPTLTRSLFTRDSPWWLLAFPTLVVISWPTLIGYVGGLGSLLAIGALLLANMTFRDRIVELEDEAERFVDSLDADADADVTPVPLIAFDSLSKAEREHIAGGRPTNLRALPMQRDGSEYEWPGLAREIEHDDLTAVMRAVEEG